MHTETERPEALLEEEKQRSGRFKYIVLTCVGTGLIMAGIVLVIRNLYLSANYVQVAEIVVVCWLAGSMAFSLRPLKTW